MTSSRPASVLARAGQFVSAAFGKREEPPAKRRKQPKQAWSGDANFLRHVRSSFPGYRFVTVFDIGAHVGAVSTRFLECFPAARLHAFEPAPETFAALSKAMEGRRGVTLNQLALSDSDGESAFAAVGLRTINRLLAAGQKPLLREDQSVVRVKTETGDAYCARTGVTSISFLKIDTEGHDLTVLKGFSGMLSSQAIDFVQVEAGMHPENNRHVPLEALKSHLEGAGYRLYQINGQSIDRNLKVLRRSDLIFVSMKLAEAHRGTAAKA